MFRYQENETVVLTKDYQSIGIPAGKTGVMWARYQTSPPSYEVSFHLPDGTPLDLTLSETEVAPLPAPEKHSPLVPEPVASR